MDMVFNLVINQYVFCVCFSKKESLRLQKSKKWHPNPNPYIRKLMPNPNPYIRKLMQSLLLGYLVKETKNSFISDGSLPETANNSLMLTIVQTLPT